MNAAVNDRLRAYADQPQVSFLNLNRRFLDDRGRLSQELMPDALHPNERGYRVWAEGMDDVIRTLMGE